MCLFSTQQVAKQTTSQAAMKKPVILPGGKKLESNNQSPAALNAVQSKKPTPVHMYVITTIVYRFVNIPLCWKLYQFIGYNQLIIGRFADYRYRPISWRQQLVAADYRLKSIIVCFLESLNLTDQNAIQESIMTISCSTYSCVTTVSTVETNWS